MTLLRLVVICLVLVVVGATIVVLRTEQARAAHQAATLQRQTVQLQRRIWRQQLEVARLRAPALVRRRHNDLNAIVQASVEVDP